ncbi:MAG: hypothetical protein ACOYL6_19445 [Bacteriovoracaceae bacterium]
MRKVLRHGPTKADKKSAAFTALSANVGVESARVAPQQSSILSPLMISLTGSQ